MSNQTQKKKKMRKKTENIERPGFYPRKRCEVYFEIAHGDFSVWFLLSVFKSVCVVYISFHSCYKKDASTSISWCSSKLGAFVSF